MSDDVATPSGAGLAVDVPEQPAVSAALRSISKSFAGTPVVEDVTLEVRAGDVLALVGENGAGKSTCVKLLAGVHRPDAGHVEIAGARTELHSPLDAQHNGVAVVHQHPGLFGDLSIAENVFVGRPLRGRHGRLDHRRMERETGEWLHLLGLDRSAATRVKSLRTSEQQLVEIARALVAEARILIMDEPTAALPGHEVDALFAVVDRLRSRGVAMMFVTHRLDEVFRLADRIAVLRDGRLVASKASAELDRGAVVRLMVGRPLSDLYPVSEAGGGEVALEVENLSSPGRFEDVSMSVRSGEIVGLAGLVGSGRTEVARALFGVEPPSAGRMELDGREVELSSSADALEHGIAYVSEDRRGQSLVLDFGILANATLPALGMVARAGFVRRRDELGLIERLVSKMRLRFRDYDQPVATLSGGNQQKVVLAKWLATEPRVLILDEPTQGIDVQAKAEIHRIIVSLASEGVAVLLISSELPELLGMCDRIAVMREGHIVAEWDRDHATQELIAAAATGADDDDAGPIETGGEAPAPPTREATRGGRIGAAMADVLGRREVGLVVAILAIAIPVALANPRFLSGENLAAILTDAGLLWILVLAQMLVLITRNIDLSVGSMVGLVAYLAALTVRDHPGLPLIVVVLMGCGLGLVCGMINGATVAYGRVPAIVATLGTLSIFRGIDHLIAGNDEVSEDQVSQAWIDLTSHTLFGVGVLFYVGAAILVVAAAALRWTAAGRELFAVGSNPDGARLIGVRVDRRILQAFAVAGVLAGLVGALWASRYATIDSRAATDLELTVIASAVVGGVAIFGGWGTVAGVALGTLLLLVIENGLAFARVESLWVKAVYGIVIVAAVAIDAYLARRVEARAGAVL